MLGDSRTKWEDLRINFGLMDLELFHLFLLRTFLSALSTCHQSRVTVLLTTYHFFAPPAYNAVRPGSLGCSGGAFLGFSPKPGLVQLKLNFPGPPPLLYGYPWGLKFSNPAPFPLSRWLARPPICNTG